MRALVAVAVLVALRANADAEPSAERLYDEGQQAFDRGDYTTAVARWQSSYELSGLPLLVLNIAQAYRLAGDCLSALVAYRQYVALDPTSEQRGLAEGFVGELEPRCGQPVQHAEVPVAEVLPVEGGHRGRGLKIVGLATGGAGAALFVTGLLFGRRASMLGDEVGQTCAQGCDWGVLKDKDARGRRYSTVGYVLDALGVATIVGGSIMYYLGDRQGVINVAPRPHEAGVVVTWSGSW
jgi:hypothetical protein